jgi:hypothetical protein
LNKDSWDFQLVYRKGTQMKRFPFKPLFVILVTILLVIGVMVPLTAFAKSPSSKGKSSQFTIAQVANKHDISAITILPNQRRLVGNKAITQQKVVKGEVSVPNGYPTDCLDIYGSFSNVTRNSTSLNYYFTAGVKNTCTKNLLSGGGWEADFQVDCAGVLINENPYLSGGLPQINVNARFTFLDGHYSSTCVDEWGDYFAPDEVTIYVSASGNLEGGGVAVGSSYFTVS